MKTLVSHLRVVTGAITLAALAGLLASTLLQPATAEEPSHRPPAAREAERGAPGEPSRDKPAEPGAGQGDLALKDSQPKDPTARALGGQIPPTASARAKLLGDLYALLATAEDEAAAKKVQEAIEKVWQRSGSDTVSVILQRGIKAVAGDNEALAEAMFDAAVELAPDYAEAWNRRAFFYYKQNDFSRALGDLRRTLALDPNHFRALEGVATILRETGDDVGAFKAYERLMEVNPLGEGVQKGFDELRVKVQGRGI